jgi:hypothetical protein
MNQRKFIYKGPYAKATQLLEDSQPIQVKVKGMKIGIHYSKEDEPNSLRITWKVTGSMGSVSEWLCLDHLGGPPLNIARKNWKEITNQDFAPASVAEASDRRAELFNRVRELQIAWDDAYWKVKRHIIVTDRRDM